MVSGFRLGVQMIIFIYLCRPEHARTEAQLSEARARTHPHINDNSSLLHYREREGGREGERERERERKRERKREKERCKKDVREKERERERERERLDLFFPL